MNTPARAGAPRTPATACVACGGSLEPGEAPPWCGPPVTGGGIARCTACGTRQVAPRPTPERLAELYDRGYYEGFMEGPGMAGGNQEVAPPLRRRLEQIERLIPKGRLLDVGCGLGYFVKHARDRGWQAAGLEPSAWAAEEGRRRNGVVIHAGSLDQAPFEPGSLDVVHAHHVVEHMLEPVASLKAAWTLLRPGGLLVIEVPQEVVYPLSDSLFRRLHPEMYRKPPPPPTHHLVFFTPRGLGKAARRAGFEVQRLGTVRHLHSTDSRLPGGLAAKRLLYWAEAALGTAPDTEMVARRPVGR